MLYYSTVTGTFCLLFEQGAPHFYSALSPENHVASPGHADPAKACLGTWEALWSGSLLQSRVPLPFPSMGSSRLRTPGCPPGQHPLFLPHSDKHQVLPQHWLPSLPSSCLRSGVPSPIVAHWIAYSLTSWPLVSPVPTHLHGSSKSTP